MKILSRWTMVVAAASALVSAVVGQQSAQAQTLTTVFKFDGTDGIFPYAGLLQATNGGLYGSTQGGGSNSGTIFRIAPNGGHTTIFAFDVTNGSLPEGALVQAIDGDLYGTTIGGPANSECLSDSNGCGTVFKITPSGTLATLYTFCSQPNCADGYYPEGGLVQSKNQDLFGTTLFGGHEDAGTVFKITPDGTLTRLHSFCSIANCADGDSPSAGLVLATDGNFYGTTAAGGPNYGGTVFRITPGGTLTTLYSFCAQAGCADGASPTGLIQGTNGNFYGTTNSGGISNSFCIFGCGTIFELTASGTLKTLYTFCSQANCADGANPWAGLVQATDGNFYGTTQVGGGQNNAGTVFEISASGTLTTLYTFCPGVSCMGGGDGPVTPLVQDTNGDLYGTTQGGGTGSGTVFRLSVGLVPFVETQTTSGAIGTAIKILGTDLTGAASVNFNGTPATFTVNESGAAITATVPKGATSGTITVTTPSGVLASNKPFTVQK
jgi:uncharacterized repeat protein (TIGR03803 family)